MESYVSTVTSKGQTTIPIELRKKLGIMPGDRLWFEERDGEVAVKKLSPVDGMYLQQLDRQLASEWLSDADDEAFRDL